MVQRLEEFITDCFDERENIIRKITTRLFPLKIVNIVSLKTNQNYVIGKVT